MDILIEKDVPLPVTKGVGLTKALRGLKLGDSFVIDGGLRGSIHSAARQAGMVIRTRTIAESPWNIRVWRIS